MKKMLLSACVALAVLGCGGDDGDLPPCMTPKCINVYSKCGDQAYDSSTEVCSGGTVYPKCGSSGYNPSTQFCSNGQIYSLCGDSTYNPSTQRCQSNVIQMRCGARSIYYNPSTQFCSGNSVYNKCSDSDYNPSTQYCSNGTVKAYSGSVTYQEQTYKTVVIGTQTWMAENLNYNVSGSKCYSNSESNCNTYGRLYDWSTAMDLLSSCNSNSCSSQIQSPHQGICPSGWHIPSRAEWDTLSSYVESNSNCSSCDARLLKATSGWYSNDTGTDEYGFSALPGGIGYSDGSFRVNGGFWLSASEFNSDGFFIRHIISSSGYWGFCTKSICLSSVRCVLDGDEKSSSSVPSSSSSVPSSSSLAPSSSSSVGYSGLYGSVAYEGQSYRTVQIGTQTWFADNLNYNASDSKCYDNSDSSCNTYGRLYDWSTAMGFASSCNSNICLDQIQAKHRGVCPSGWHIPSRAEWTVLTDYVRQTSCYYCAGTKLKAASGWYGNGTDDYGFSALPGGYGDSGGSFGSVGYYGNWWSATESSDFDAYGRSMGYDGSTVGELYSYKSGLYSVRCVQD